MVILFYMTSPQPSPTWALFESIASESYFDELVRWHKFRRRKRIYCLSVVIWLMIYQRLHCDASLTTAVLALPRRWRQSGTRISAATGAYCQARQRVPTLVAEQVSDHIFETLQVRTQVSGQRPVWLVDGTTLRMEHEAELVRAFPPGHNRHGENRWPVMLLVAFHDAHTGLAARPSWGPMYGPKPASEQQLAAQALARVPADALVLGDGNFGIFAFAHTVVGSGRPVLLRLTAIRANSILGKRPAKLGCHKVIWRASAWDRKMHPELPPEAHLEGWVVVCRHPLKKGERLYFFTTLEQRPRQVLACYKLRWNIETDLRHLKRTVNLYQLRGRSLGVVEKEVLLAVTAYNLVRAVMFQAAQLRGCSPRQLSFAHVQAAVLSALPGLEQARSQRQREQRMRELVQLAAQLALPRRKRKRSSYPREVWKRGASFPIRTLHPKPQELP
jgi:hypothetical protein